MDTRSANRSTTVVGNMAARKHVLRMILDIALIVFLSLSLSGHGCFFTLEYVILIWNDTANVQIYSFQVGESNRLDI